MDCTICVAKTKALISFAVTSKLICVFVFAYAKSRVSHGAAQMSANSNLSLTVQRRRYFYSGSKLHIFGFDFGDVSPYVQIVLVRSRSFWRALR